MRLQLFFIRCLAGLARITPFRLMYCLGWLLGSAYAAVSRRDMQTALRNTSVCFPERTPREHRQLARASIRNLIIGIMEAIWVWSHPPKQVLTKLRSIDKPELIQRELEAGHGVVVLLAHLGQWEIMATYLGHHYEGLFLARSFDNPALDSVITRGRESAGGRVVFCNREGLEDIYQTCQQGKVVGMLTDQQPDRRHGVFAPLFNTPALTTLLAQDIAQKTGARIVTCICRRLPLGRGFAVEFGHPDEDVYAPDPVVSATGLNKTFEAMIRRYPEQYSWNYKRFKRQPLVDGKKPPKFYPKD